MTGSGSDRIRVSWTIEHKADPDKAGSPTLKVTMTLPTSESEVKGEFTYYSCSTAESGRMIAYIATFCWLKELRKVSFIKERIQIVGSLINDQIATVTFEFSFADQKANNLVSKSVTLTVPGASTYEAKDQAAAEWSKTIDTALADIESVQRQFDLETAQTTTLQWQTLESSHGSRQWFTKASLIAGQIGIK